MSFQVNDSFNHGLPLNDAVTCLKSGVDSLISKYPNLIDPNPVFSENGESVLVSGSHFKLKITVDALKVAVTGTEDFAGHLVHSRVKELIQEMFV